jgi:uncharacterized membrane protein YcaP (DUF421 family)
VALYTVLRAAFGYLFLVFIVRIVGRRPGKQLTPFEFVLIFYLGGLTLTGIVGPEMSLTNAACQILTIALCHHALTWLRIRSDTFTRILCGIPLVLLSNGRWRSNTLNNMRLQDDDVMDMAREQGLRDLARIRLAVLETFGSISIIAAEPKSNEESTSESQDSE